MSAQEFELQFWVPKKRGGSWVAQAPSTPTNYSKTWRRVLKGSKHPDKLTHSIARVRAGSSRSRQAVIEQYLDWARSRGLKSVAVYADEPVGRARARAAGFDLRVVEE